MTRSGSTFVAALVAILMAFGCGAVKTRETAPVAMAAPSGRVGSPEWALTLETISSRVAAGEPVDLRLKLWNKSGHDSVVWRTGDGTDIKLEVRRLTEATAHRPRTALGEEVRPTAWGRMREGDIIGTELVPVPHERFLATKIRLNWNFDLSLPGCYRVTARWRVLSKKGELLAEPSVHSEFEILLPS